MKPDNIMTILVGICAAVILTIVLSGLGGCDLQTEEAPQIDSITHVDLVNLQDYCLIDNRWQECPAE